MKKWLSLFSFLTTFSAGASAQDSWPPLPDKGFVVGRPATLEDIKAGNAVFVASEDGRSIGKPLDIIIPQYAYLKSEGLKIPVILVQAEEAKGMKMVGARDFSGQAHVANLQEFQLLGLTPHSE